MRVSVDAPPCPRPQGNGNLTGWYPGSGSPANATKKLTSGMSVGSSVKVSVWTGHTHSAESS